ncbi:PLP-dependent aminotransferase family protein [Bradyrhizobium sp. Arg237L]|uniref:MocR-like pyridoxine biosynthesis transcription factor PdxR n=1 Tax=Bradyrhizobium sp. Arg237L TaxID=3003352 RepID=UPI00249EB109|nr:PLP-dependent aminotransferase family protein [Bradyrhizobium sp. Arg237L]MDI4237126.1 PLP-dependent aminotransferase family protein [Bradyrhizobium sp. Arg237L]
MQLPIVLSAGKGTPLQQQLVDQIHGMISRGVLLPGTQIPSSREMADQLGISRRTVVLAYDRLIDDGSIETRPARGTFVCNQLPSQCLRISSVAPSQDCSSTIMDKASEDVGGMKLFQPVSDRLPYDFRIGKPDPSLFPRNHWRRLTSELLEAFTRVVSDYNHPAGHPLLRSAIAQHLRMARGILCRPEQVIVTAGAQEGLNLVARLMNIHGKPVVVEDPCYHGAAQTFLSLGGELTPVAVTDDGIDTDLLPTRAGCLGYVTPSHQFPLGVTMSQERRLALIAWARSTGALLVEDDYDSDFRHNSSPLVALQALGAECVVYLGTFSKSIGPGLRLGYAVFPDHLVDSAAALKSIMNNGHPWLEQAVTAQFITSGAFEHHLSHMRTAYLERRNALVNGLKATFPATSTSGYEGGMHLVWQLSSEFPSALEVRKQCRKLGVGVYTLDASPSFQVESRPEHERRLLLGYAGLTREQIMTGISRIQRAFIDDPPKSRLPLGLRAQV